MASSSKQKTTFAKLARERKLRERREYKQAKKEPRRQAAAAAPAGERETQAADPPAGDP
jgi:hypothetical protein